MIAIHSRRYYIGTTAERTTLASTLPADVVVGVHFFDTDEAAEYFWNGSAWVATGGGAAWPYDKILTVSPTNAAADYPTLQDANDNTTGPAIVLPDGGTYTETLALDSQSIGYTALGNRFEVTVTSAGATTITISAVDIAFRNLTIQNTNAGATAKCVSTDQDSNFLENVRILKTSGAATTSVGVHVSDSDDVGTIIKDSSVLVTAGTTRYGVLVDTGTPLVIIDGGTIQGTTADIRINAAGARVELRGPQLLGGGISLAAGTVTGWYYDSSENIVFVSGSGTNDGLWLRDLSATIRLFYSTLTATLSALADGDAIDAGPGTHTGTFAISASGAIKGSGPEKTTITNTAATTDIVLTISDVNVEISDLAVSQTGAGGAGVSHTCLKNNQAGLVLDNVWITKTTGSSTNALGFYQIAGDALLRNCKINVSAASVTNYAILADTAASTIVVEGGEIAAGEVAVNHASAVIQFRGTKFGSGVTFTLSAGVIRGDGYDSLGRQVVF